MRLFGRRDNGTNGTGTHGNGTNGNGAHGDGLTGTAVLEADPSGVPDLSMPPADAAGPSILLTYDGWTVGQLVHSEARVLDALSSSVLRLRNDGEVREIERDEVLMVVPPPITEVSPLRVAKQPITVAVNVGVATLRGQIHVVPGASPWETWQRSPSGFVAITSAVLEFPDGTTESADVVLVSRHAAHAGLLPA